MLLDRSGGLEVGPWAQVLWRSWCAVGGDCGGDAQARLIFLTLAAKGSGEKCEFGDGPSDPAAAEAVRELWVRVRCDMTGRTNA